VKLLLNLALLAGDALVRGGLLDIGAERRNGGIELAIRGEGPRVLLDPVLRETLVSGVSGPVEARAAAAWLAYSLAQSGSGAIQVSEPGEGVLLIGAELRPT